MEKITIFKQKIEIRERCKAVYFVDLGESFPTHIYLQNLASIQPRTSPVKFARPTSAVIADAGEISDARFSFSKYFTRTRRSSAAAPAPQSYVCPHPIVLTVWQTLEDGEKFEQELELSYSLEVDR